MGVLTLPKGMQTRICMRCADLFGKGGCLQGQYRNVIVLHGDDGNHYVVSGHRMSRAEEWDSFTVLMVTEDSSRAQCACEHLNRSAEDGTR